MKVWRIAHRRCLNYLICTATLCIICPLSDSNIFSSLSFFAKIWQNPGTRKARELYYATIQATVRISYINEAFAKVLNTSECNWNSLPSRSVLQYIAGTISRNYDYSFVNIVVRNDVHLKSFQNQRSACTWECEHRLLLYNDMSWSDQSKSIRWWRLNLHFVRCISAKAFLHKPCEFKLNLINFQTYTFCNHGFL